MGPVLVMVMTRVCTRLTKVHNPGPSEIKYTIKGSTAPRGPPQHNRSTSGLMTASPLQARVHHLQRDRSCSNQHLLRCKSCLNVAVLSEGRYGQTAIPLPVHPLRGVLFENGGHHRKAKS
jgi:hypothetical protein